ncbi:HNH endonuclease [Pseudomonas sp. Milli4]|uniref:HNH endonuclease n=2 Tax=Pseudomonas schmalbachii TaxID=2816993 RepID=A0ABS3TKJ3_9PSED|nr:HNH endonuclease [Pseudomonas schmalbachii]
MLSSIAQAALDKARAHHQDATSPPTRRPRQPWSEVEVEQLVALYPDTPMYQLVERFGRTDQKIYAKANKLGLRRSEAFLASPFAGRIRPGAELGKGTRFQKGHKTWNAGISYQAGGRAPATRFKPGQVNGRAAQLLKPIGYERVTDDGILQRKIRDDGPPQRRWKSVHMILWEEQHGPVPAGHMVAFRDGNRRNFAPENLVLISRAENMQRNSIHRYPPELKDAIRAAGKLKRTIREKEHEEQDRGSA